MSPGNFKKYILDQIEKEKPTKIDYSKWNTCPICMCELYPEPFESSSLEQMQQEDQTLLMATQQPVQLQEHQKAFLQVVKFSDCTGEPHLFHKECVESHFASMNSQYYKCVVCQKQYGTRTGEMPPGTMSWTTDPNLKLSGYEDLNYGISINYSFPNG